MKPKQTDKFAELITIIGTLIIIVLIGFAAAESALTVKEEVSHINKK